LEKDEKNISKKQSPELDTNPSEATPLKKSKGSLSTTPLDLEPFPNSSDLQSKLGEKTIQAFRAAKVDPIEKIQKDFEGLEPLEREVLIIAEEILKQKRYKAEVLVDRVETMSPLMDKLYSKCIAKLTYTKGIEKSKIFKAIQSLSKKNGLSQTKEELVGRYLKPKPYNMFSPLYMIILVHMHEMQKLRKRSVLLVTLSLNT